MTRGEAVNWIINISADIGKAEHCDLWHYEQALYEIRDMLEETSNVPDRNIGEWDMFELITSAYYGKMMYSMQGNGIVYSRYSRKYMQFHEAIKEFLSLIDDSIPREHQKMCGYLKRGKWTKVHGFVTPGGDPTWQCSECGKGIHVYGIEHNTYGSDIADGQWVTCPNCGAWMNED